MALPATSNVTCNGTALSSTLGLLAPAASPTLTGTVDASTATTVKLPSSANVTLAGTALLTTLGLLAPLASPTFTGTTTISGPIAASGAGVTSVAFPASSAVTFGGTTLAALCSQAGQTYSNVTLTGTATASAITAFAMPALTAVTYAGTALSTTLATYATNASPTHTGTVTMSAATSVLLPALTAVTYAGTALSTTLGLKANAASPTFTGTVTTAAATLGGSSADAITVNGTPTFNVAPVLGTYKRTITKGASVFSGYGIAFTLSSAMPDANYMVIGTLEPSVTGAPWACNGGSTVVCRGGSRTTTYFELVAAGTGFFLNGSGNDLQVAVFSGGICYAQARFASI